MDFVKDGIESRKRDGYIEGVMRITALSLLSASLLLLTGCDKKSTLYANLEERQANMVMAALRGQGISCEKSPGDEGTWTVMIDDSRFAEAVTLCERNGLPPNKFYGIGEVFRKSGMVSSPSEERIRFMDATAQDLAKTISMLEGVVNARVHVVLPENDPFAKNVLPSSAAVAIRARWDADLAPAVPQIKSVVRNAIEGLAYEKISVTIFQDQPPK